VLEIKAEHQEWAWVAKHVHTLLSACPRKSTTEQHRRNRAQLLMLLFLCRMEMGGFKHLEASEQKYLFSAWPYSVRAWSLYSRCAPALILWRPVKVWFAIGTGCSTTNKNTASPCSSKQLTLVVADLGGLRCHGALCPAC
jgi:hypothetical protein